MKLVFDPNGKLSCHVFPFKYKFTRKQQQPKNIIVRNDFAQRPAS